MKQTSDLTCAKCSTFHTVMADSSFSRVAYFSCTVLDVFGCYVSANFDDLQVNSSFTETKVTIKH